MAVAASPVVGLIRGASVSRPWRQQERRVEADVEQVHAPVEMGPGHAPGRADFSHFLPLLYTLADTDRDSAKVRIGRGEAKTVVEHQRLAGEEHSFVRQRDDSIRRRHYRRRRR